jgi:hypothetical protein
MILPVNTETRYSNGRKGQQVIEFHMSSGQGRGLCPITNMKTSSRAPHGDFVQTHGEI